LLIENIPDYQLVLNKDDLLAKLPVEEPFRDGDEFIQIAAVPDPNRTLEQVCEREAAGDWTDQAYGTDPRIDPTDVKGQAGCLIREDEDAATGRAALVVEYPEPVKNQWLEMTFSYVIVRANSLRIDGIAETVQFEITPKEYLDSALTYIEQKSLFTENVDWQAFRAGIHNDNMTIEDAHILIKSALRQTVDYHAYLFDPYDVEQITTQGEDSPGVDLPTGELMEERIGYINLPGMMGNAELRNHYADAAQGLIRQIDQNHPCGWIVDVRENTGGSFVPMIVGIGPILGGGNALAFANQHRAIWFSYQNGEMIANGDTIVQAIELNQEPYELQNPMPPVAVLTSQLTRSAGEMITVAFRGRPDTQSFGKSTGGFTTGIEILELFDGAFLTVSFSWFLDRNEESYKAVPLKPDEPTSLKDALPAATKWLLQRPACSAGP